MTARPDHASPSAAHAHRQPATDPAGNVRAIGIDKRTPLQKASDASPFMQQLRDQQDESRSLK